MSDSLLTHFNNELAAIRQLAGQFSRSHPAVAERLRLAAEMVDDPHVSRLLDGVAFLSARVHQRLDDEFPELTDALLSTLYPHMLDPLPSTAIVRMVPAEAMQVSAVIPAGTPIETDAIRGDPCRFRTTDAVELWPIEVSAVRLSGLPLAAPVLPEARGATACLRISLRTTNPDTGFADLGVDRLRFFLRGAPDQALPLYKLLCSHRLGVCAAAGPNDPAPTRLPPDAIRPAGFAADEALFPWSRRGFSGFRLLFEYFAQPEKFLFVDITGLDARTLVHEGDTLDLFVYFDQHDLGLERRLRPDAMALGCTPVVNLFNKTCEPLPLDQRRTEYSVVPDYRRPHHYEVWHVLAVRELFGDGTSRPWRPFYQTLATSRDSAPPPSYTVSRRASLENSGSDVLLAPFDPASDPAHAADVVLSVDALCTNRDLPGELPFGAGQPVLHLPDGNAAVERVECLTAPSPTLRPALRDGRAWQLISQLSLGHLSLVGGADAAASLRRVLQLYNLRDSRESRALIDGLVAVDSRPATARVPDARPGAFCRGLDVTLTFEPEGWALGGPFLLASLIERFLALNVTINSFVRVLVALRGRPGLVARFPPRAGARTLA